MTVLQKQIKQLLKEGGQLTRLLAKQKQSLNHFFDKLDLDQVQNILTLILNCKGKLIFSGVGKSALMAKKISASMCSVSQKSCFLDSQEALHGDLGLVEAGDLCIFLSKSGESDELLELVGHIQRKGAKIISWVSSANSRLAKVSDFSLLLPLDSELCPFDLAPTTSCSLQLLVGDLLVISLMEAQEISLAQYGQNHPSGRIGKRITYLVSDLMLQGEDLPFCSPEAKVMDVLVELSDKRCGCVLVLDEAKRLLGIFTDGDLRRTLQNKKEQALSEKVQDVMTLSPRVIEKDELAFDAMKLMEADRAKPVMVLPVVDGEKVVGLIKMHDIVQIGI